MSTNNWKQISWFHSSLGAYELVIVKNHDNDSYTTNWVGNEISLNCIKLCEWLSPIRRNVLYGATFSSAVMVIS